MDRVRTILFGMTGFGNNALEVLIEHPFINLIGVFTPKRQDTPFPYYECEGLCDKLIRKGINVYEGQILKDEKTYHLIKGLLPDLIVISSFNQIIPQAIISIPKFGVINVHPSLLPKYRGPTPTVWVLMNGEKETGVTAHFIEDERIDCGRIIKQARLSIDPSDTNGTLRQKLTELSEAVLNDALNIILAKSKKIFPLQNESNATYYPKYMLRDAEINPNRPFNEIVNKIKAMFPYPCAYLKYNGRKYIVKNAILFNEISYDAVKGDDLAIKTSEGIIKFQIARESLIGI